MEEIMTLFNDGSFRLFSLVRSLEVPRPDPPVELRYGIPDRTSARALMRD